MATKLTKEECLNRCISVHGNRYDYSKSFFNGTRNNISIICKKHGQFYQRLDRHIRGEGCRLCWIDGKKRKNSYFNNNDGSVSIVLTQGKIAIIDKEDLEKVLDYCWHANLGKKSTGYYARTNIYKNGNRTMISMHRLIMNFPKDLDIDHINHNTLDNRKINLREATRQQNTFNSNISRNNKIGYKGVSCYGNNGKYLARICGKNIGVFKTPYEAARAYDKAAKEIHGEFARLNFKDNEN